MSLQDEIEKLINSKRRDLEQRDTSESAYRQRQCERFAPLRSILEEMMKSIEPEYLEIQFYHASAVVRVGQRKDSYFEESVHLEIEPNFEISWGAPKAGSNFREAPGFLINETQVSHSQEFDDSELELLQESEKEVAEYLIRIVTDEVAKYRHYASLRAKLEQE